MLFPESLLTSVSLPSLPGIPTLEAFRSNLSKKSFEDLFHGLSDLLEYRDVAEDLLEQYGVSVNFTVPKSKPEERALACSQAVNLYLKNATGTCLQYKDFCLKSLCEEYLEVSDPVTTVRPRLKTPLAELESLLKEIESVAESVTNDHLQRWMSNTGNSYVSLLSIIYAFLCDLDIDDLFLNCPKPSIKGALCTLRNATEGPATIKVCKKQTADLPKTILLADGCFYGLDKDWKQIIEPNCLYGALVPGASFSINGSLRRYMVVAKGSTAVVYAITYGETFTATKKLELDLQEETPIDLLDCQRDRDNNIVLLWGHRNHLTGNAELQYFAWTEEEFLSKKMNVTPVDTHKLPNRLSPGTKIDFRDHGNVLALVTLLSEDTKKEQRSFTIQKDILFGNTIVKSVGPDVFGVYGSPAEYVVLKQNKISGTEDLPFQASFKIKGFCVPYV